MVLIACCFMCITFFTMIYGAPCRGNKNFCVSHIIINTPSTALPWHTYKSYTKMQTVWGLCNYVNRRILSGNRWSLLNWQLVSDFLFVRYLQKRQTIGWCSLCELSMRLFLIDCLSRVTVIFLLFMKIAELIIFRFPSHQLTVIKIKLCGFFLFCITCFVYINIITCANPYIGSYYYRRVKSQLQI